MLDIRDFIPKAILKRWASYTEGKKRPREPEQLELACDERGCKISYNMTISPKVGSSYVRAVSVSTPRFLEYDARFNAAVVAYVCEGDYPKRANGVRIGLNNSDWRIVRLVVNEFEKLGLRREKWNVRLELYQGTHDEATEKEWWSEKLEIPLSCFTTPTWFEGTKGKEEFSPHGRARIQRSSTIFAAVIDSTCGKVVRDLLG
jgi:hypothetical protein